MSPPIQILVLRRNAARAVAARAIAEARAESRLERLIRGPVVGGFTVYLVIAAA